MTAESLHQGGPASVSDEARELAMRTVVQRLRLVYRSIQEHSRWVEKQCGVSGAQLWVMWELQCAPGMRVSDLSRALSIHQSTTSNLLDKLEAKGLVRRERGGPDHRVVRLYLTETGDGLVAQAPRPARGALSEALESLSDEALGELDRALAGLVEAMTIKDVAAALRPLSDH